MSNDPLYKLIFFKALNKMFFLRVFVYHHIWCILLCFKNYSLLWFYLKFIYYWLSIISVLTIWFYLIRKVLSWYKFKEVEFNLRSIKLKAYFENKIYSSYMHTLYMIFDIVVLLRALSLWKIRGQRCAATTCVLFLLK